MNCVASRVINIQFQYYELIKKVKHMTVVDVLFVLTSDSGQYSPAGDKYWYQKRSFLDEKCIFLNLLTVKVLWGFYHSLGELTRGTKTL